jgi:hypothetical protein
MCVLSSYGFKGKPYLGLRAFCVFLLLVSSSSDHNQIDQIAHPAGPKLALLCDSCGILQAYIALLFMRHFLKPHCFVGHVAFL